MKKKFINVREIVWVSSIISICITIWFGMFLYHSTEEKMAEQFNAQQIILAQETATGMEEYMGFLKRTLTLVSSMDDWWTYNNAGAKNKFSVLFHDTAVIDIWHINRLGEIDYSIEKPIANELQFMAKRLWWQLGRLEVGENKVSGIFKYKHLPSDTTKAIVLVSRLAQTLPPSNANLQDEPARITHGLAFVVSLNRLFTKFITPIKSGNTGYAWLLDDNGVLLHHP